MSPADGLSAEAPEAGFTIIEVLIALAIVAVSLVAIGSVMSGNARGARQLENHVALIQRARAVMTAMVPPRKELAPGALSGQNGDYRWQVDVGPVAEGSIADKPDAAWIPLLVRVRVRSPSGATLDLETVRLMHRPRQ